MISTVTAQRRRQARKEKRRRLKRPLSLTGRRKVDFVLFSSHSKGQRNNKGSIRSSLSWGAADRMPSCLVLCPALLFKFKKTFYTGRFCHFDIVHVAELCCPQYSLLFCVSSSKEGKSELIVPGRLDMLCLISSCELRMTRSQGRRKGSLARGY